MKSVNELILEKINSIAEAAHSAAKATVLKTLNHWAIQDIKFTFDGISIEPAMFQEVAKAIQAGRVKVKFHPFLAGSALYESGAGDGGNTMYVGFMNATTIAEQGLIVHEAVHAAMDVRKLSQDTKNYKHQYMMVVTSESCAYIAQALYQGLAAHGLVTITAKGAKWESAMRLADMVYQGQELTWDDCQELRKAIAADPEYKSVAYTFVQFDGVAA